MSYDIQMLTRRGLEEPLAHLAAAHRCEYHKTRGGYLVCLSGDDEAASEAWVALVALAKESGARLHDPQAGSDVNLDNPGSHPPMWGPPEADGGPIPDAPTRHVGVGVRLYTVSIAEARQVYVERFGGTVVAETADLIEIDLCGVRFSLRVKPRRQRAKPDYVGDLPHRVRTDSTVIVLAPEDYDRMAERVRRTGEPPWQFAFEPALREVPGEAPAHCFVVRDANENFIEFRAASGR